MRVCARAGRKPRLRFIAAYCGLLRLLRLVRAWRANTTSASCPRHTAYCGLLRLIADYCGLLPSTHDECVVPAHCVRAQRECRVCVCVCARARLPAEQTREPRLVAAYCVLLRLIASYCALLHLVAPCCALVRLCDSAPRGGAPARLVATYCCSLRLIAAYCGLLRLIAANRTHLPQSILRQGQSPGLPLQSGLLRLVAA